MKKTLLLLSLLLTSYLADANPLFFPTCKVIEIKGQYEYFYDGDGILIGREDVGSSGRVYFYVGDGEWDEEGYFIEENGWCLYYCTWLDNEYIGKARSTSELYRDGSSLYDRVSRFYVDTKNRPVATYYEGISGLMGETVNKLLDAFNPLGLLLNGGKSIERKFLILNGEVRIYKN